MTAKLSEAETAELLRCFRRAVDAKIARDLAEEDATARALKDRVLPVVRTALAQPGPRACAARPGCSAPMPGALRASAATSICW